MLTWIKKLLGTTSRQRLARRASARPRIEELEVRLVLSPVYEAVLLSDLSSVAQHSRPFRINEQGDVVGEVAVGGLNPTYGNPIVHAALWTAAGVNPPIDLGDLPLGNDDSQALDINNRVHGNLPQVTGNGGTGLAPFHVPHAFLWTNGAMTELAHLHGPRVVGELTNGYGLNDAGQVVGISPGTWGSRDFPAAYWFPENNYVPMALPDLPGGLTAGLAYEINNSGVIVGRSSAGFVGDPAQGNLIYHAVRWVPSGDSYIVEDLLGEESYATDINDKGQIVGQTGDGDVFIWLPTSDYGMPQGISKIVHSAAPFGINNSGQVVGTGGFLWDPKSGLQYLSELVPASTRLDVHFSIARDINDKGQIVVEGRRGSSYQGVVLSPVPHLNSVFDTSNPFALNLGTLATDTQEGVIALRSHDYPAALAAFTRGHMSLTEAIGNFAPGSATRAILNNALTVLQDLNEAAREGEAGFDAIEQRDFSTAGAKFERALDLVADAIAILSTDAPTAHDLESAGDVIRKLFEAASDVQTGLRAFEQRDWARSTLALGQGLRKLSSIAENLAPDSPAAQVLSGAADTLRNVSVVVTSSQQAMKAIQQRNWAQAGTSLGQAVNKLADAIHLSPRHANLFRSTDAFIRSLGEAAAATERGMAAFDEGDYADAGDRFGDALAKASALVQTLPAGTGAATVLANASSAIRTLGRAASDARSAFAAIDKRDFMTAGSAFSNALTKLMSVGKTGLAAANPIADTIRNLGAAAGDAQTGIAALGRRDFSGASAAFAKAITKLSIAIADHPEDSKVAAALNCAVPVVQSLGDVSSFVVSGISAIDKGDYAAAGEAIGEALGALTNSLKDLPALSNAAKAIAKADPVIRSLGSAAGKAIAGIDAIRRQDFTAAGASLGSAMTQFAATLKELPVGAAAAKSMSNADIVLRNLASLGTQVQTGIKAIQKREFTLAGTSFGQAISSLTKSVRVVPADSPVAISLASTGSFVRNLGAAATATQNALASIQKQAWSQAGTSLGEALLQFSVALHGEEGTAQTTNFFTSADTFVRSLGAAATATQEGIAAFDRRDFVGASKSLQTALMRLAETVGSVPATAGAAAVLNNAAALIRTLGGAADDAVAGIAAIDHRDFLAANSSLNQAATKLSTSVTKVPANTGVAKILGDAAVVVRSVITAARSVQRGLDAIKSRDYAAAGVTFAEALTASAEALKKLPHGSDLGKVLGNLDPAVRSLGSAAAAIKTGLTAIQARDYVSAGASFAVAFKHLAAVVEKAPQGSGISTILTDAAPAIEKLGGTAQAVQAAISAVENKDWLKAGTSFTSAFRSLSEALNEIPANSALGRSVEPLKNVLGDLNEGIKVADKLLTIATSVVNIVNNLDNPLLAAVSAAQGLSKVVSVLAPAGSPAAAVATNVTAGLNAALSSFQVGQWIGSQVPESQAKGALGGTASGAVIGTMALPGLGTIIGAIAGGLGGFFGSRAASHAEKAANLRADLIGQATQVRAVADFFLPAIEQLGGDVAPLMDKVASLINSVNAPGDQQGELARFLADELMRVVRKLDPSIVSLSSIDGFQDAFMKHLMSRATAAPKAGQTRPLNEFEAARIAAMAGFDISIADINTLYVTQYGELTHMFANVDRASQQDVDSIVSKLRQAGYSGPLPTSLTTPVGPGSYGGGRPLVQVANALLRGLRNGWTPEQTFYEYSIT